MTFQLESFVIIASSLINYNHLVIKSYDNILNYSQ